MAYWLFQAFETRRRVTSGTGHASLQSEPQSLTPLIPEKHTFLLPIVLCVIVK